MYSSSGNPVLLEVYEPHRIEVARLDSWLADRLDGFGDGLRVLRYEGGQLRPAFSLFRFAAILQGVYRRGLEGNAASREALSKRDLVRGCAETGWRLRQ